MSARAPSWWHGEGQVLPLLLAPLSLPWIAATALRKRFANPYRSRLPVICVGNPTVGGGGKTPAAIAIAKLLIGMGEQPVFLSRGHGGSIRGPHLVDPRKDRAGQVGDEPLLLVRTAPVIISARRDEGARLAEALEASVIVMDDGFQNPGLVKDFSLLAVDSEAGVGNGRVVPAGPLRAPLGQQLAAAQALLLSGEAGDGGGTAGRAKHLGLTVIEARLVPTRGIAKLKGKKVVAFAGIARPGKFFDSLSKAGAKVVASFAFADHRAFTQADVRRLLDAASKHRAQLVTTEKDYVRITHTDLLHGAIAVPVKLVFGNEKAVIRLLRDALAKRRKSGGRKVRRRP